MGRNGEDKAGNPGGDALKFATYARDGGSGLDYADQRYYSSNLGRFMSPDTGPAILTNPQTWNRYSYVSDDPANENDPSGRFLGFFGCFGGVQDSYISINGSPVGCPVFFPLLIGPTPNKNERAQVQAIDELEDLSSSGYVIDFEQLSGVRIPGSQ